MPDPNLPNQPPITPPPTFPEIADIPAMPQDINASQTAKPMDIPPMIASSQTPKKKSGRIIVTILGILLLVGAVGAGVVLVGQEQLFQQKAGSNICTKSSTSCPVNSSGCVYDDKKNKCNDKGQMCTYYYGEIGWCINNPGCTSTNQTCTCDASNNSYYCIGGTACISNQTCEFKPPDNCVADESCGGSGNTPTPEPTLPPPLPPPQCNSTCTTTLQCGSSLICHTTTSGKYCRNADCVTKTNCVCAAPTPVPPPTPTPVPRTCNQSCSTTSPCKSSLICYSSPSGKYCRKATCPAETDCDCATPGPVTPPPPQCGSTCTTTPECGNPSLVCHTTSSGKYCRNADCVTETNCVCPTPTPTPTPTETPTPTPTPGINAVCSAVKAYDTDWNLLDGTQLSALSAGDTVIFAVSGTPVDQINSAQFTVNGELRTDVILKEPGTYYIEYTIPPVVMSFTVTAQLNI